MSQQARVVHAANEEIPAEVVDLAAALAQSPPPVCGAFATELDHVSRTMAKIEVLGEFDDSAPRAQLRELQKQTQLQRGQIIVQLMAQHHCPPANLAPNEDFYLAQWSACAKAMRSGAKDPPECKF